MLNANIASIPLASFAGSVGALGIVYALASARRRGLSTIVLLLAGVTMTAFFQALIGAIGLFVIVNVEGEEARTKLGDILHRPVQALLLGVLAIAAPFILITLGELVRARLTSSRTTLR